LSDQAERKRTAEQEITLFQGFISSTASRPEIALKIKNDNRR
jgi:hypothetical protein